VIILLFLNIIEIGSRDGHDTHYIRHYFNINSENCFIIEAHPQCFKNIISQYPQYKTFNIAASNQTGIINFNAGIFGLEENVGVSSVLNRTLSSFTSEQIEVDGWRMEEVMSQLKNQGFEILDEVDLDGIQKDVLFKNINYDFNSNS